MKETCKKKPGNFLNACETVSYLRFQGQRETSENLKFISQVISKTRNRQKSTFFTWLRNRKTQRHFPKLACEDNTSQEKKN